MCRRPSSLEVQQIIIPLQWTISAKCCKLHQLILFTHFGPTAMLYSTSILVSKPQIECVIMSCDLWSKYTDRFRNLVSQLILPWSLHSNTAHSPNLPSSPPCLDAIIRVSGGRKPNFELVCFFPSSPFIFRLKAAKGTNGIASQREESLFRKGILKGATQRESFPNIYISSHSYHSVFAQQARLVGFHLWCLHCKEGAESQEFVM